MNQFPGFSCSSPGLCSKNDLADDIFGIPWIFFQVCFKRAGYGNINDTNHFRVAQFCFRLSFKLWLRNFYRNDGRESFPEIITFHFHFGFFKQPQFLAVLLEYPGYRSPEASHMGTAFNGVDVVDVRENMFVVRVVVVDGHFNSYIGVCIMPFHVDDVRDEGAALSVPVQHLHKLNDSAFTIKYLLVMIARLIQFTEVIQGDADAFVQVRQFTKPSFQDILVVYIGSKNRGIWPEMDLGSSSCTASDFPYCIFGNTALVLLLKGFSITVHRYLQCSAECIYATDTHTM